MRFIDKFMDFLDKPYVKKDEGKETKRARDPETKAKIEELYEKSSDAFGQFERDMESGRFNMIS